MIVNPASSMNTAREGHTATVLNDGMVLVVGGKDPAGSTLYVPELYDPASDVWLALGSVPVGGYGHTATLLQSGRVLIAGGGGGTAEYDPLLRTSSVVGPLATSVSGDVVL